MNVRTRSFSIAEGSANEDHFVNNQWESLLQTANQKCVRIELVELFAITILDALIDCEFPLTQCSLPTACHGGCLAQRELEVPVQ